VLVVCHDPTVDRTTETAGEIANLTLADVQALDNAYWWVPGTVVEHDPATPVDAYVHRGKAPSDSEFRIPTVAEVLEAFPSTFMNFDIKRTAPAVPAYERALADELRAHGRIDDIIVASFNDASTEAFAEYAPEIATSYGTAGTAAFYRAVQAGEAPSPSRHVALQVPHTFGEVVLVDERFVDVAHAHGIAVHVWTIDDEDEMNELLALGVDGIMTDLPRVLETALRHRGL
jgi:glycerophosphoryl diester phosphodiesterase